MERADSLNDLIELPLQRQFTRLGQHTSQPVSPEWAAVGTEDLMETVRVQEYSVAGTQGRSAQRIGRLAFNAKHQVAAAQ